MVELAWKFFALTGNVDIYLLFKELDKIDSAVNVSCCHDCGSSQLYNASHLYKINLNQVEKNPSE